MHDVSIIDYKMGNLYSVDCALKYVGVKSIITDDLTEIKNSKCIILPGVGAFPEAMKRLKEKKLDQAIKEFNESKKLIIGICLGMQILFSKSHENGTTNGLGLLKGEVKKFDVLDKEKQKQSFNVGWRTVEIKSNNGLNCCMPKKKDEQMYFIHSYHVVPEDYSIQTSTSKFFGNEFTSSVKKNNIEAFQFHPEKSRKEGLTIYKKLKEFL